MILMHNQICNSYIVYYILNSPIAFLLLFYNAFEQYSLYFKSPKLFPVVIFNFSVLINLFVCIFFIFEINSAIVSLIFFLQELDLKAEVIELILNLQMKKKMKKL